MKKILVMACSVIILAAIAISGTIAYFTDSDEATNVFTVGNVVIDLIEQQRGENGLEDFEDDKNLMPLVGELGSDEGNGLPTASNFVDKIVTVKNTGKSDAYVRVYVGVPKELDTKGALHFVDGSKYNTTNNLTLTFGTPDKIENQTVGTETYNFYCFTLDKALPINTTTGAAIVGFYLDSKVDYDDGGENSENAAYYIGDKSKPANKLEFDLGSDDGVKIPVYVQAVQNAGFNNSATAFGTAFTQYPWGGSSSETPSATPAPAPSAITPTRPPINNNQCNISSAAELLGFAEAVNAGTEGYAGNENLTVTLTNDIVLCKDQQWTPIGQLDDNTPKNHFKGTFDGNNKTIYHLTFDFSGLNDDEQQNIYNSYDAQGLFGYCEGTIQNLTLDHASITGVSWVGGIAGYLDGNGKIENCKVNNSTIKGFYVELSGYYEATAGAIVGQANANASLTNCKASNCNVYGASNGEGESGEKYVGTIAGVAYHDKVPGCSATNCKAYYKNGATDAYHIEIVGKYEFPSLE